VSLCPVAAHALACPVCRPDQPPAPRARASPVPATPRRLRPTDVCTTQDGYAICDSGHHRISMLSFAGSRVTPLAGCGKMGFLDGPAAEARFHSQHGICQGPRGALIIADTGNHVVRMLSNGVVSTIAGRAGLAGSVDGPAHQALLSSPLRVAMARNGSLLIADGSGGIRVMHGDWSYLETLVPPSGAGEEKHCDGPLDRARMSTCDGICVSAEGSVLIADSLNHCLRVMDPQLLTLTTLAGKHGEWGAADGAADACRMNRPCGICSLSDGSLIFADAANNSIRVVTFATTPHPVPSTPASPRRRTVHIPSAATPVTLRPRHQSPPAPREPSPRSPAKAAKRAVHLEAHAHQPSRSRDVSSGGGGGVGGKGGDLHGKDGRDSQRHTTTNPAFTNSAQQRARDRVRETDGGRRGAEDGERVRPPQKARGRDHDSPLRSSPLAANPWVLDSSDEEERLLDAREFAHRGDRGGDRIQQDSSSRPDEIQSSSSSSSSSPPSSASDSSASEGASASYSPEMQRRGTGKRRAPLYSSLRQSEPDADRGAAVAPEGFGGGSEHGGAAGRQSLARYAERLLSGAATVGGAGGGPGGGVRRVGGWMEGGIVDTGSNDGGSAGGHELKAHELKAQTVRLRRSWEDGRVRSLSCGVGLAVWREGFWSKRTHSIV